MLTVETEISAPRRARAVVMKNGETYTVVVAAEGLEDVTGGSLAGAPGIHCEAKSLEIVEAAYRAGLDAIKQARVKLSREGRAD